MKFSLSWLKDHLSTSQTLDGILSHMLKAGLEVEAVDDPADALAAFSVAKVTKAVPHPDADKLRICTVETVDGTKQIVCGAPNARAGMTAIYAPLGAYIPGLDFSLDRKPRKIRGVESHGMLCSAKEINAGEDHDGIADLAETLELGMPAADALDLNDPVIDFEVTPNRPDWLGVVGIARDLAAAGAGTFSPKTVETTDGAYDCPVDVVLENTEACPVFAGALIRDVKNVASPDWLQARLRAVGFTPKSLLVDVSNYISIDRARPLHAYDADKLQGKIRVRLGRDDEMFDGLDGKQYKIGDDMCVITDDSGVIGLGGIMGGQSTAVSETTTNVFIESAWFDPLRSARTGRTSGIISDARYRFERGVDPSSCEDGVQAAINLILEYAGGSASNIKLFGAVPKINQGVTFYIDDVQRLTGLSVTPESIENTLIALGFGVEKGPKAWSLKVPEWRFDITQSADIVEEVARLEGYDNLPTTSLPAPAGGRKMVVTPLQQRTRTARRLLASRGYLEAVTWSFLPKQQANLFGGGDDALTIANPVASELNQMRPSILPNLATASQRAANRSVRDVRIFEAGPIYLSDNPNGQYTSVSAIVRPETARHWQAGPAYSVFDCKADLFALLTALGQTPDRFQIAAAGQSHWHPGQSAALKLGPKVTIAHFGALHPGVLDKIGVDGPLFGFELDLDALPKSKAKASKTKAVLERSDLQPVRRDFAFIVDNKAQAQQFIAAAKSADKQLISGVSVFDLYKGERISSDMMSIAIEVTLQPRDKTLTDADIEAVSKRIIAAVEKATGATLRR
ncbi:MAG: Phenylalanine--tRNA ligase beta subunit [Hyphomonas sp. TMED17]|nr:MAG: Phenylalanine--tRNA ligase beta subunit [Hyphomonas sp. TMED17]